MTKDPNVSPRLIFPFLQQCAYTAVKNMYSKKKNYIILTPDWQTPVCLLVWYLRKVIDTVLKMGSSQISKQEFTSLGLPFTSIDLLLLFSPSLRLPAKNRCRVLGGAQPADSKRATLGTSASPISWGLDSTSGAFFLGSVFWAISSTTRWWQWGFRMFWHQINIIHLTL